jgi:hypothetical protein
MSGWKEETKSTALSLGSLTHQYLASFYQDMADMDLRNYNLLHDNHIDKMRGTVLESSEFDIDTIRRAGSIVQRYITDYSPYEDEPYEVSAVEKHLVLPLTTPKGREFNYQLYLDLLMHHKASDKYWLFDHKTHTSRPYTEEQAEFDPQMASYAAVLRKYGVDVFGCAFNLLNTYDYKNPGKQPLEKFYSRVTTYRTQQQLDSILDDICKAADDIFDNHNEPRRELSRDCSYCWFKEPCLMLQKGFSEKEAFSGNYVKSDKEITNYG